MPKFKTPIWFATLLLFAIGSPHGAAADGTWSNPAAVVTAALTSSNGSSNLTWAGSAFAVGQEIRLTATVPGGFSANANYFVVYASGTSLRLATAPGGPAITATSTLSNGTAQAYQSWQTRADWTGGVANGTDAVATFV